MNNPAPLPPVMPLPGAFEVPPAPLAPPSFEPPRWTPVPIYREDIPALVPETEPQQQTQEQQAEPQEPAPPSEEVLDLVDEMRTFTPPIPPYFPEPVVEETMDTVELPGGVEVPVPPKEILVTAVTTAGVAAFVSVGATMAAGRLFEQIVKISKPIFKTIFKKLAAARGKDPGPTWARVKLRESHPRIRGRRRYRDGS